MDLFNRNTNKRKFSKLKEQEENLKKNNIEYEESINCFKRCCTRKKHQIISVEKEKLIKTSNQSLKQNLFIQTMSNIPVIHLKRSPLYNQSKFCQQVSQFYDDPCIECTVQYGPDTWENIPKNSKKLLDDINKIMSIERYDIFMNKRSIVDNNSESLFANKRVNSFINNIIGDGVDQISKIITPISTDQNKQKEFTADNQLSKNSKNNFQENELKKNSSDFEKIKQNQYQGLIFEKQNFKKPSQINDHSSNDLPLENASSQIIPDDYNWNLVSNEINFDQQNLSNKDDLLQNQEPYNWDYQEYQWPSSFDSFQKNQLIDKVIDDSDNTDTSYSIASALPSNKRKKTQPLSSDRNTSTLSHDILNQQQTFSKSEIGKISDHKNKSECSQQNIYSNGSTSLTHTNSNQQQKSLSNLSKSKNLISTTDFTHSSKLNHDKFQLKNSSHINLNNDISLLKSSLNPFSETPDQNDRLSSTSISDLFKEIRHTKKQKSLNSDSVSTTYSIPISVHPSVSPSEIITDEDRKNHAQSSQTSLTSKHLSVLSNTETKQSKNIINIDTENQNKLININLPIKRTQSHLTDTEEKEPSNTDINNTFNQVRSTYDDIMTSWRHLFERLLNFMLSSIDNSDHNINLSSSSAIASTTQSWSTLFPSETLNVIHSDNIGPWWGRRDAYDQTPATLIFANESLSTSYSIESIPNNKQMYISIKNRPCYFKYYNYSNAYNCCCKSSITINNSSSSPS